MSILYAKENEVDFREAISDIPWFSRSSSSFFFPPEMFSLPYWSRRQE